MKPELMRKRGQMRLNLTCLSIAVLALGLAMTAPAFAGETGKVAAPEFQAAPVNVADLAEPAPMTPAEATPAPPEDGEVQGQEIDDIAIQVDPSRGLQVKRIRACEPEEEVLCPPGCGCVWISSTSIRCFC